MSWVLGLPGAHEFFTIGLMYATFYSLFMTLRGLIRGIRSVFKGWTPASGDWEPTFSSAIGHKSSSELNRWNIHNDTYRYFS